MEKISNKNRTNLPNFSFLKGYGENDELYGRDVIFHIGSCSILEVFNKDNAIINKDSIYIDFYRNNLYIKRINDENIREHYVMVLHHTPFLDIKAEEDFIIKEIILPAIRWYIDYCYMMDEWLIKQKIDL